MVSISITFTVLSCSMQANLEEFVEEGISIVKITSSSYSQGVSPNIVANRSVLSGSEVTVNLEFLNPEGLDLVYEIGYDANYVSALSTIAPTGPGQNSVSFTFNPSTDAENQTIVFTIAIRSVKLNKIVARKNVSIPCVYASNTDIHLQAILESQNVTYAFSGTGQTSAIMDLTTANTLTFIPTAEVSGQTIAFNLEANGSSLESGLTLSGEERSLTLVDDDTYTLSIIVTAPDTITNWTYTIKVPKGFVVIEGGNYSVATFQAKIPSGTNRIKLGGDITLTDIATTALISNSSNDFYFDGNGYKISNMTINATADASFIDTNNGIIKNLALENVSVTSSGNGASVAGLVECNNGTIYRCSVSGTIISTHGPSNPTGGGLVAYANSASYIAECYSTANVHAGMSVGGLVGCSEAGTILNCYARGTVSGSMEVGVLVGTLYAVCTVRNSYATGTLASKIFGKNYGCTTNDCFYATLPTSIPGSWNYTTTLNPAYVWGIGSGINGGYPYLQYFGAQTMLP